MVITDKATEMLRAKVIYLGSNDSEDNYKEIPKDTPLPKREEETKKKKKRLNN